MWNVGPANLAFSAYEFLGLAGLGPPRNEIRETIFFNGIHLEHLIELGCLSWILALGAGVSVLLLLGIGGRRLWHSSSRITAERCILTLALNWALLFSASLLAGFPFWGRHLSPCFPGIPGLTPFPLSLFAIYE